MLNTKLIALMNKCDRMRRIEDNDPEKIFKNIPWLKNYHHTEILFKGAEMRTFNSRQILLHEDEASEGIYVITSGV